MNITHNGTQPSRKGPEAWFTGSVRIDPYFGAEEPSHMTGSLVTFEPGARTAWHSHPVGQTLVVTAGFGRAQAWGGPLLELRPGDVVRIAPNEKHWHGASPTTAMSHIALSERDPSTEMVWMEKVTDEQYLSEGR